MTKLVRIENADMGDYKVSVEVWDHYEGQPDTLAKTIILDHPTAMTDLTCYLTSNRYLIIREKI